MTFGLPVTVPVVAQGRYPDVASFLLSDALGGEIISGFLLYPVRRRLLT